jgi:hypothetical protein
MKLKTKLLLFTLVVSYVGNAQNLNEINRNFDWNSYKPWENTTVYSKTYVVNRKHPNASDKNQGTENSPLLTINKAAELVKAGERVLIHAGVYREMVLLRNQGTAPNKMISIEAAQGEEVIVSGSKILNTKWVREMGYNEREKFEAEFGSFINSRSRKIWHTQLDSTLFENGYYPFQLPNIQPFEYSMMPWAEGVKNMAPFTTPRGLIFQNGKRMVQLINHGDLTRLPGSYCVAKDGKTIFIHPFEDKDPNNEVVEVTVNSHLLKPVDVNFGYIHLSGITFQHCANGFLRTSYGAVNAMGGHHWIIENNIIRHINSAGLEFGNLAFEPKDPNPLNKKPRPGIDERTGAMIVRNNTIYDCGTAGMRSYKVRECIVENNTVHDCCWQDGEEYYETAGIKLLSCFKTVVRNNHIYNMKAGHAIWMDWDNQYSRVSANNIHNIQTIQGAIYVEASRLPNMVDNNVIWEVDGEGVCGHYSSELIIVHNLLGNISGSPIETFERSDRKLNGQLLMSQKHIIKNNLIVNAGKPMVIMENAGSTVDYNLYVTTREPHIDFSLQNTNSSKFGKEIFVSKQLGYDTNSKEINAEINYFPTNRYFEWKSVNKVFNVPGLPYLNDDFFGKKRTGETTIPGPFKQISSQEKIFLR